MDGAGRFCSRWRLERDKEAARPSRPSAELQELDREIRLSIELAKLVHDRRKELGLSQQELAERCGLTQAKISRIEGSDTVPTLPLLAKLARGLDASLNVAIGKDDASLTLVASDAA